MDNYEKMAGSCLNCEAADREIDVLERRLEAADRETLAAWAVERTRLTAADALAGTVDNLISSPHDAHLLLDLVKALRAYREATDNG